MLYLFNVPSKPGLGLIGHSNPTRVIKTGELYLFFITPLVFLSDIDDVQLIILDVFDCVPLESLGSPHWVITCGLVRFGYNQLYTHTVNEVKLKYKIFKKIYTELLNYI